MPEYIERESLIKRCKMIADCEWNTKVAPVSWADAYESFIDEIEQLPAIDVAPAKKSFWEAYDTVAYVGVHSNGEPKWVNRRFFRCERCRKGTAVKTNYCSNCGAKMDGGADG